MLKEAWTLAIEAVSWMEMQRLGERLALARTVKQLDIRDADAVRFAHMLVYETVKRKNFIDRFINCALRTEEIGEYSLGVQSFLRLYVYQTRIAKGRVKIDIKEAESIVKSVRSIIGWKTLQRVEPFLGRLLTQKSSKVLEGVVDEERMGLMTFHPTWFVRYCFRLFGRSETVAMLEANIEAAPTYIRLNTLKSDDQGILSKLAEEGIKVEKVEHLQHAYTVKESRTALASAASFRGGLFYVQDKASCLAAEVADPKEAMTVLDVCAAPGAKTTYLAQLMKNRGSIYSVDYSKRRMDLWKREVSNMGALIAEPLIADARQLLPVTIEADVVALDPPCTGTGTFRKSPSAKWRLTPRSVDRMAEIQWQMLNNCTRYVKPGGTLVYSTCSITVEENEMLIERLLKHHPEFSLADVAPKVGLPGLRGLEKCRRLFPHIHQCNGFFVAKLQKAEL